MWKTKCSSSKWQIKTSSVTKGLRKQNVELVQHGSARRSAQRWETYIHQSSNLCIAEMQKPFNVQFTKASNAGMQNRSMFSSQKRSVLECQRGTSNNVHQIHSRSERCGNLLALQGAEKGPKAGRESPPVCETGSRNPCEKSMGKKLVSPLKRPNFASSETNARLDRGWNLQTCDQAPHYRYHGLLQQPVKQTKRHAMEQDNL